MVDSFQMSESVGLVAVSMGGGVELVQMSECF